MIARVTERQSGAWFLPSQIQQHSAATQHAGRNRSEVNLQSAAQAVTTPNRIAPPRLKAGGRGEKWAGGHSWRLSTPGCGGKPTPRAKGPKTARPSSQRRIKWIQRIRPPTQPPHARRNGSWFVCRLRENLVC